MSTFYFHDYNLKLGLLWEIYAGSGGNLSFAVETYTGLLNTTNFALLGGLLCHWAFLLRVVHQLSFHNPLGRFNASGKRNN